MEQQEYYSWESEEEATEAELSSVANVIVGFVIGMTLFVVSTVVLAIA